MVTRENHSRNWIAWAVTIGEMALLMAFGFVLSQYWLMLPVWMRSTAGFGLGFAMVVVAYRFFKFRRSKKAASSFKEIEKESPKAVTGHLV
jgi:hypothetical protein